mmetsp:Transcript_24650/g.36938  ORF Transcript_24650/g.36938 Transcript_24650/m.36938 type:complete len:209 (-) Transcript_24650:897-1523(-)
MCAVLVGKLMDWLASSRKGKCLQWTQRRPTWPNRARRVPLDRGCFSTSSGVQLNTSMQCMRTKECKSDNLLLLLFMLFELALVSLDIPEFKFKFKSVLCSSISPNIMVRPATLLRCCCCNNGGVFVTAFVFTLVANEGGSTKPRPPLRATLVVLSPRATIPLNPAKLAAVRTFTPRCAVANMAAALPLLILTPLFMANVVALLVLGLV